MVTFCIVALCFATLGHAADDNGGVPVLQSRETKRQPAEIHEHVRSMNEIRVNVTSSVDIGKGRRAEKLSYEATFVGKLSGAELQWEVKAAHSWRWRPSTRQAQRLALKADALASLIGSLFYAAELHGGRPIESHMQYHSRATHGACAGFDVIDGPLGKQPTPSSFSCWDGELVRTDDLAHLRTFSVEIRGLPLQQGHYADAITVNRYQMTGTFQEVKPIGLTTPLVIIKDITLTADTGEGRTVVHNEYHLAE